MFESITKRRWSCGVFTESPGHRVCNLPKLRLARSLLLESRLARGPLLEFRFAREVLSVFRLAWPCLLEMRLARPILLESRFARLAKRNSGRTSLGKRKTSRFSLAKRYSEYTALGKRKTGRTSLGKRKTDRASLARRDSNRSLPRQTQYAHNAAHCTSRAREKRTRHLRATQTLELLHPASALHHVMETGDLRRNLIQIIGRHLVYPVEPVPIE